MKFLQFIVHEEWKYEYLVLFLLLFWSLIFVDSYLSAIELLL